MSTRIALNHRIDSRFNRRVQLSTHWLRLRPAPHVRDRIEAYSLKIDAEPNFLNWVRDPYENFLARLDLPEPVSGLGMSVEIIAELSPINPFNFLVEPYAFEYPFKYPKALAKELGPYLGTGPCGPRVTAWLDGLTMEKGYIAERLGELNSLIWKSFPAGGSADILAPDLESLLAGGRASPADLAWLLVLSLRRLGLAARFTTGYQVTLAPPEGGLDWASLHAWAEAYLPGAGWIGLDPAIGIYIAEGYIPLASAPEPLRTLPIIGYVEACQESRSQEIQVKRLVPEPASWPYGSAQWADMRALGGKIESDLRSRNINPALGVDLAFVSARDACAPEWTTAAVGPFKRQIAEELLLRLRGRLFPGGALHLGQSEWFGGEAAPRWRIGCFERADGQPAWRDPDLFGWKLGRFQLTTEDAKRVAEVLAGQLGVASSYVMAAQEDGLYQLWTNRTLIEYTPASEDLRDPERRQALASHLSANHGDAGYALPLRWDGAKGRWSSGAWTFRRNGLYLSPGEFSMGYRLPLESLPSGEAGVVESDPERCQFDDRPILASVSGELSTRFATLGPVPNERESADADNAASRPPRTAICVQARHGRLYVFIPPLTHLEHYLELVAAVEATAAFLQAPVILEGYEPPEDHRLLRVMIEPGPGTLKLSLPETLEWTRQLDIIETAYAEAEAMGLRAERIMPDGKREPPGGRAEVRLRGETAAGSPFLRRPEILRSLIAYWQKHPSLSYFFAGRSIGPGGDAPRPDEGRDDALYELATALDRIPEGETARPWVADRLLRHLLADQTGDMKRAEIRIDQLYPPERSSLRLGRIVIRAFETPPHARMAALQALLVKGLLAFVERFPQSGDLVDWGPQLHDRFMLPRILWEDLKSVLRELEGAGYPFQPEWFEPFMQLRFPLLGRVQMGDISLELRQAHEPWPVLAEETTGGGTARFIDSANGRLEVTCTGLSPSRYALVCNGYLAPLQNIGIPGEAVAGVRYKASNPPSTLHPTRPEVRSLVFDLVDLWTGKVVGGCTYFPPSTPVWGPAGLPAESRGTGDEQGMEQHLATPIIAPSWSSGGIFLPCGSGQKRLFVPAPILDRRFPFLLDLARFG